MHRPKNSCPVPTVVAPVVSRLLAEGAPSIRAFRPPHLAPYLGDLALGDLALGELGARTFTLAASLRAAAVFTLVWGMPGMVSAQSAVTEPAGNDQGEVEVAPVDEGAAEAAAAAAARAAAEQAAREAAAAQAAKPPVVMIEAKGLDARVRRLSDEIALAIKRLPGDHRAEQFSIMPFEQIGAEVKSRQLGLVVADLVLTNLARDHRISITERSQLNQVLSEKSIAEMGLTMETQAIDVGQIMQARALVIGQIADVGNDYKVQIRLLDVGTARVVHAATANLPKEELIAVSANAVVLRSKAAAMFRSAVAPGWGQVYNGQSLKAGLVGGAVGSLVALTLLGAISTGASYALYNTANKENNFYGLLFLNGQPTTQQSQAQQISSLYLISNVALYATGGLALITALAWGLGVTDAYASGVDVDTLDQALVRQ